MLHDELRPLVPAVDAHTTLLSTLTTRLEGVEEILDTMTQADKFQAALVQARRTERKEWWTVGRKATGAIVGLILVGPAVHDLAAWFF